MKVNALALSQTLLATAVAMIATGKVVAAGQQKDAAKIEADRKLVADLDTRYQRAVEVNDAATMATILHDDFVLVLGTGETHTKSDLLDAARSGSFVFERQVEDPGTQMVRVWGDTAVVTARLWLKGTKAGVAFERRLWFSDTYVRTPQGWKYVFGQASLPLPAK